MDRRSFLFRAGAVAAIGASTLACGRTRKSEIIADPGWGDVRSQFDLSPGLIDMSALFIASHPKPVRDAIEHYRRTLDQGPTFYIRERLNEHENEILEAAASYLATSPAAIALTDSTTMGLGLIYNGLRLKPGQELLTTEHDYYATHESLRLAAERTGATVRQIKLFNQPEGASVDEIVNGIVSAIAVHTRVLALTWVHSSTGLKLPLRQISEALDKVNADREEQQKVLLCVDGVHGFGVEDLVVEDTGCDFFMAGCHKWLFGPRGSGIIWGSQRGWSAVTPIIPTFMDDSVRNAWMQGEEPSDKSTARRMTPGGFKAFEHQWALSEAFHFHLDIGKHKVAERTHQLNSQLKEGLASMSHVRLHTPLSTDLSAGIVCFDVDGFSPRQTVSRLRQKNVVATPTPYADSHARLGASVRNSTQEVEVVLNEIRNLA